MKLLLVRPETHPETIGINNLMLTEPLDLMYVAGAFRNDNETGVRLVDMNIEKKPLAFFLDLYQPDVVAFTSYIVHVKIVLKHARIVKEWKKQAITVVGGVHAEVNPRDFESEYMDYIVTVNGIKTIVSLVDRLKTNRPVNASEIPGIWTGDNRTYEIDRDYILPQPDRDIVKKYRKHFNYLFFRDCALLKTSYGCPQNCDFCYCTAITRNQYYEAPLEYAIEDLKRIPERHVFIVDDNFLVSRQRIVEFCRLLRENGIRKKFAIFGRADFIAKNEDIIKLFAEHGLYSVFVGIESFKEEELMEYNKKTTAATNVRALEILKKHNVDPFTGIIVNYDYDRNDFEYLIKCLKPYKLSMIIIQTPCPFPGTPYYERVKEEIRIPRERYESWDMSHIMLKTTKLDEVEFNKNVSRVYFRTTAGPMALLRFLRRFGPAAFFRTLKNFLFFIMHNLRAVREGARNE
jgi:radical SAM superfamily enzyme YgiQ (UPF0313 family)